MTFRLPLLPYSTSALGTFMSAETLEYHHGKHHKAYVDKTNTILAKLESAGESLVEVIRAAKKGGNESLYQNSAQIWNHSFFWQCLAPPEGQRPTGMLGRMIDDTFGSIDQLFARLNEAAVGHFSNGWAWLVLDRDKLRITSLHDADTPIVHEGLKPLLTLDVWEHAYYIDYRNSRGNYAGRVLENIVNWAFVAENLDGLGEARADQQRLATRGKALSAAAYV